MRSFLLLAFLFCAVFANAQDCTDLIQSKIEQYYVNIDKKPDSLNKITCQLIQNRLGPNEVFIDFMQVEMNQEEGFFAIVVKKTGEPDLIEIPKLKPVHTSSESTKPNRGGVVQNEQSVAANYMEYDNLLKYINPSIQKAAKIYYSTSDVLNFVNLKHLKDTDGKFLFQKYQMVRLHTAASFLNNQHNLVLKKKMDLMVIGNVCYECDDFVKPGKAVENSSYWSSLPGSKKEVETIHSLLKQNHRVDFLDSCKATEKTIISMLNKTSYDIVHLATHGFYFTKSTPRFGVANSTYPLLAAGIVLSGANNKLSTVEPFNEYGMLTAVDFKSTNISNIKLIVLSTCYSGEGTVTQSAAPVGLTTALLRQGISAMMVSNQAIPDEETTELMITFYSLLAKNPNVDQCFIETLKKLSAVKPKVDWSFIDIVH